MIKIEKREYAKKFCSIHGNNAVERFERVLWQTGSLASVAEHFKFSRAYSSVLFKKLFKITLKEYLALRFTKLEKIEPTKVKSYKTLMNIDLNS